MKMGMEIGPRLDQRQKLENKLGLRQELVQKVQAGIELAFADTPDAPERQIGDVVKDLLMEINADSRKTILEIINSHPDLLSTVVENAKVLAVPSMPRIEHVLADYFYNQSRGEFQLEDEDTPKKLDRGVYDRAIRSLEQVQKDIEVLMEFIKKDGGNSRQIEEQRDLRRAIVVAESAREHFITPMSTVLVVILRLERSNPTPERHPDVRREARMGEVEPSVQEFLREKVITDLFLPQISERIVNRFAARCRKITRSTTAKDFELAFLNTVSEIALVSLGILGKELFEVKSVPEQSLVDAENELEKAGFSKNRIRQLFGNLERDGIFWHRWKTKTLKPSAETDEKIAKFRTEILRKSAADIIASINFKPMFETIKRTAVELRLNTADKDKEIEAETEFIEVVSDVLSDPGLFKVIQEKAKGEWYRELERLF